MNRRKLLKSTAFAAGGTVLSSPLASAAAEPVKIAIAPKRFVFFIYSNGFHPDHVCPSSLRDTRKTDKLIDVELAPHELPKWTAPLEKYKERMTILHGVNGRHCNTSHGTPFGCLAGLKKGKAPKAQTIDHALGSILPAIISGAEIVAVVLSLETTGPLLIAALQSQDMYLAGSFLMFLATLTVVGVLISDIALAILDPRIRLAGGATR